MTVKKFGRLSVCAFALAFGLVAFGADYDINPGDDTATIQAAIDGAAPGATLTFAPGEYPLTAALSIPSGKSVTLLGTSYTNCVLKQTTASKRVMTISSADAIVDGFTITGGAGQNGSGISMSGGLVRNCRITGNKLGGQKRYGVGVYMTGGTLLRSVVDNNGVYVKSTYFYGGGGIGINGANVTVDTCLICGNTAMGQWKSPNDFAAGGKGGGIYVADVSGVRILNSTIVGNTADVGGGGIYCAGTGVTVENCIISGNKSSDDPGAGKPNWGCGGNAETWGANVTTCLFGDGCGELGTTSYYGNPQFVDPDNSDYHLLSNSDALDRGTWYEGIEDDLDGLERGNPTDIGCYELETSKLPFSCLLSFAPQNLFIGGDVTFTAQLVNPPEAESYTYEWTLVSTLDETNSYTSTTATFAEKVGLGRYTVHLKVTAGGETANYLSPDLLFVAPPTNYVTSAENPNARFPYATPETAATRLTDALTAVLDGSVVSLDAGTHLLEKTASLEKRVTLCGAGRDATILTRSSSKMTSRFLSLNHAGACVRDLTLRGASAEAGSGVYIAAAGGMVTDCRITQCYSADYKTTGGALNIESVYGVVENCIIDCNTNNNAINYSTDYDWPFYGVVGISGGTLRNSLVCGNYTGLTQNNRCYASRVVNISGNGRMENCTVVDNTDIYTKGGVVYAEKGSSVLNCIFARNSAPNSTLAGAPNWVNNEAATTISNNCWAGSIDLGSNCVDGDKIDFKDADAGDYRIGAQSSGHRKGILLDWMAGAVDLDGNPRVVGRRPDLGCYECPFGPGLMLLLR